jgi:hypothetical protein
MGGGGRLSPSLASPHLSGFLASASASDAAAGDAASGGNGGRSRSRGGSGGGVGADAGGDGSFFSRRQAQLLEQQQARQQRASAKFQAAPPPARSGAMGTAFGALGGALPSGLFGLAVSEPQQGGGGPSGGFEGMFPGGGVVGGGPEAFGAGSGVLSFDFGGDSLSTPEALHLCRSGGAFGAGYGAAALPADSAGATTQQPGLGAPFSFLPPQGGAYELGLGALGLGQAELAAALEDPELLARLHRVRRCWA